MPLPSRTAVRLLAGLLVAAALVGGLWWNFTRLNETERKLVGVWECVDAPVPVVKVMLPNRRHYFALKVLGEWNFLENIQAPEWWSATAVALTIRSGSSRESFQDRITHLKEVWAGENVSEYEIAMLTDDATLLQWRVSQRPILFRKLQDPKLLATFDRLSAGESP